MTHIRATSPTYRNAREHWIKTHISNPREGYNTNLFHEWLLEQGVTIERPIRIVPDDLVDCFDISINSVLNFKTEQDKLLFVLRWS